MHRGVVGGFFVFWVVAATAALGDAVPRLLHCLPCAGGFPADGEANTVSLVVSNSTRGEFSIAISSKVPAILSEGKIWGGFFMERLTPSNHGGRFCRLPTL